MYRYAAPTLLPCPCEWLCIPMASSSSLFLSLWIVYRLFLSLSSLHFSSSMSKSTWSISPFYLISYSIRFLLSNYSLCYSSRFRYFSASSTEFLLTYGLKEASPELGTAIGTYYPFFSLFRYNSSKFAFITLAYFSVITSFL